MTRGTSTSSTPPWLYGAILFGVGILIVAASWPRVMLYMLYRDSPERRANLWVVPVPLPSLEVSGEPGTKLSYAGLDFEVPWRGVQAKKEYERLLRVQFDSGIIIVAHHPDHVVNPAKTMRDAAGGRQEDLQGAFGEETLRTPYDFYDVMLRSTPDDVVPFMGYRRARGMLVLFVLKSLEFREGTDRIYSLELGEWRGFQFGDPSRARLVRILLFDRGEKIYQFQMAKAENSAATLTQGQINRVLTTLVVHQGEK
jgi:hypothetical protein